MGKLYLKYDPKAITDGYFAQLQRQIGIFSITKIFRCEYLHCAIEELTVTQLDDFQTREQIDSFLDEMNSIYNLPSSKKSPNNPKEIKQISLTLKELFILRLSTFISRRDTVISLAIPYGVIERKFFINQLQKTINHFPKIESKLTDQKTIVMHIRRGVKIEHIVPGENNPRVLTDEYFLNVSKKIIEKNKMFNNFALVILTDAPGDNIIYKPVPKDKEVWEKEFDRFKNNDGIEIEGHRFSAFIDTFKTSVQILRGGNLQTCLEIMATADHFIMSRSSMSYVGALLNKNGVIYYPPNFWHKPLKNWMKIS